MPEEVNRRQHPRFQVEGSYAKVRCESFEVDGASARVRPGGVIGALTGFPQKQNAVINISKGGLAFESEDPFERDQKVKVLLQLPGREAALTLSGKVRWQKGLMGKYILAVGVKFDTFGPHRGQNSLEALDALRDLEAEYASRQSDGQT